MLDIIFQIMLEIIYLIFMINIKRKKKYIFVFLWNKQKMAIYIKLFKNINEKITYSRRKNMENFVINMRSP